MFKYFLQNLDTNYSFPYLLSLIMCESVEKMLGRSALCIKISSDSITFLIMMFFLDFSRTKIPTDIV